MKEIIYFLLIENIDIILQLKNKKRCSLYFHFFKFQTLQVSIIK